MGEHVWKRAKSDKKLVNTYKCEGCGRSLKIRLMPLLTGGGPVEYNSIEAAIRMARLPKKCPRPVPSTKDLKALWELARQWVTENQVRAPESIYQVDSVNIACQELAEGIVDLVGCYEDDIQ